jgi:hypothetical protein
VSTAVRGCLKSLARLKPKILQADETGIKQAISLHNVTKMWALNTT